VFDRVQIFMACLQVLGRKVRLTAIIATMEIGWKSGVQGLV
jgi:hypothetical protein